MYHAGQFPSSFCTNSLQSSTLWSSTPICFSVTSVWILKMSADWALWVKYRITCDGYTYIFFSFERKHLNFHQILKKDALSNKARETSVTLSLLPPTRKPYVGTPNLHFHFFCSSQLMQVLVVTWIRMVPRSSYIWILVLMEWQYLRRIRGCGRWRKYITDGGLGGLNKPTPVPVFLSLFPSPSPFLHPPLSACRSECSSQLLFQHEYHHVLAMPLPRE